MNTVVNPTKEQVKEFCSTLEAQLLSAIDRGANLEIGMGSVTRDLNNPAYGMMVIDTIYIGAKFMAQFRERGF